MIKKIVAIITIMSVSALLNGMEFPTIKKTKSKQSPKNTLTQNQNNNTLSTSKSATHISSTNSSKPSVKNLNDLKDMKRVQNEYRDKAYASTSEKSVDKK